MSEACKSCGNKCNHAIQPLVRGWQFYKALLVVFILPLAGFILGLTYTRQLSAWLSFLLACGIGTIAFIPAILIDKRGAKYGTTQSKLR